MQDGRQWNQCQKHASSDTGFLRPKPTPLERDSLLSCESNMSHAHFPRMGYQPTAEQRTLGLRGHMFMGEYK